MMKVSDECLKLVSKWEGFYSYAYLCPANVWTIGYGTTKWPDGRAVKKGDTITREKAWELLKIQVQQHADTIPTYVKVELNQNQYDALASLQYNCGRHILKTSHTLRNALNKRDWNTAANALLSHNKARVNGVLQELKGLTNRRKEERALFLKKWEGLTVTQYEELKKKNEVLEKELNEIKALLNNQSSTPSKWAEEGTKWVTSINISDGTNPHQFVTREQVWTMLYRSLKLNAKNLY